MSYIVLKNSTLLIDMAIAATDSGWRISDTIARHGGCFAGTQELIGIDVIPGTTYHVEYEMVEYTSATVNIIVGGVNGVSRNSLGIHEEEIVVPEDATDLTVKFYSDGELGIKYMAVYPILENPDNSVTLGFNVLENKWVTYYSYSPEFMLKYVNDFYCFKDGRLWRQNKNETRNNFFGVQYSSKITFYINTSPTEIKQFFSIREKGNKVWSVPEAYIRPTEGKSNGQLSRLKKGRFKNLQGDWFADFLKDMNDPRFNTELEALLKGGDLQGSVMKVTIENDDVTEVRLLSVDVLYSPHQYTY